MNPPSHQFHSLESPAEPEGLDSARALRNQLCELLLSPEPPAFDAENAPQHWHLFHKLQECQICFEPLTKAEQELLTRAEHALAQQPCSIPALASLMVLRPAHLLPVVAQPEKLPNWFMKSFLDYLLAAPMGLTVLGEADRYVEHLERLFDHVLALVNERGDDPVVQNIAFEIAKRIQIIPAYFSERELSPVMRRRAELLAFCLRRSGQVLEAEFPPRPQGRKKIRIGYLSAHLGPQTETYTTVPSFYLDRTKFEVCIYVLNANPSPIEHHCRRYADRFVVLPPDLPSQVNTLRGEGLDVLVMSTNMTACPNTTTLLGMHRLAPLQLASSSSPMSPGLPYLDGFLSGIIHGYDGYQEHFSEPLLLFDGAISCLEYSVDATQPTMEFRREQFGIPRDAPLFVSAANFVKILPEMQLVWAEILASVPGSYLLLHPFNPNWFNSYPILRFRRDFRQRLEQAGVAPHRVIVSEDFLPGRAEVTRLLSLGDLYLDTYPFSGSVSFVDPLTAGVPPVAWAGKTLRSLMAASMLSDLGLNELVTTSREDYISLAVRLINSPEELARLKETILIRMEAPRFFDVHRYGYEVGRVLEELVLRQRWS